MNRTAPAAFLTLAAGERKRPLRKVTQPALPRFGRNAAMGALAIVAANVCRQLIGPRKRSRAKPTPEVIADVLLLDYTLWWWHRWNHEWPPLWRFHSAHHADRDLDSSTALRFHPAEQFLAQFFRWAQIRLIRPSQLSLDLWQALLVTSILFHHSNLRLPVALESRLLHWIVTPRMHGIHHADDPALSQSNYASLLSWWDVVHGTLRLDVPQDAITIGLPR